jgi:hypothetical protein
MDTYDVRTHGIWSSHFAEAGKGDNPAYDISGASVTQHAVWWLWPNTCLLRYPGRGNFMVFQVIPAGPDRTLETWDFFFETDQLSETEVAVQGRRCMRFQPSQPRSRMSWRIRSVRGSAPSARSSSRSNGTSSELPAAGSFVPAA